MAPKKLSPGEEASQLPANMGWRAWDVAANGKHLQSPSMKTRWESPVIHGHCKDALPAIGNHPSTSDWEHCFNSEAHLCGVHSAKDPKRLFREGYFKHLPEVTKNQVLGSIRHHGVTLEGEQGHRSENATMDTLWVNKNPALAARLRETYPGVQVLEEEHPLFAEMRAKRLQRKKPIRIEHKPENGWDIFTKKPYKNQKDANNIVDAHAAISQYNLRAVPHSGNPSQWMVEQGPSHPLRRGDADFIVKRLATTDYSHHAGIPNEDWGQVSAALKKNGFVVASHGSNTTMYEGPGRTHIFVWHPAKGVFSIKNNGRARS